MYKTASSFIKTGGMPILQLLKVMYIWRPVRCLRISTAAAYASIAMRLNYLRMDILQQQELLQGEVVLPQ